jgi:hypothetical protein
MGAITRAAANNITTSGVILPAGINDASVASLTALAQVSAGDGITYISSQTASSSASLSFTTGIDSTYRTYLFKFINMHPATNNVDFTFNLSTDSGSNYNVTKTTTMFRSLHDEAGTSGDVGYRTAEDLAQSTAFQIIMEDIGNDADESTAGTLILFNPSSTTYVKHYISNLNAYHENNYTFNHFSAGYGNTTSAVDAVRFQMSSGNIDSGIIHMYGIA